MEKVRCVKIARQAFDSLEEKDANAMYFVNTSGDFGPESLETGGEIWLGDKLISVGSRVYYAECATAAATTAKVATVVGSEHFVAAAGVMVIVKFANKNTGAVASLTLNVNSTGAHAIKKIYTTSGISNLTNAAEIAANSFIPFIFTGTYWLVAGLDYNTNTQRTLATVAPKMDGVAAVGTSSSVARQDHVHPTDTSRAADADVIHKTGNETIDGVKTFSNSASACELRMDGGEGSDGYDHELRVTFSENNDEVFELGLNDRYHNANHKVKVSGVAVPSANYDAANKKYVDETVSDVVDETINDTVFVERADIRTSLLALTHRNGRLITDGTWFGSGKHVMYPISSTSPFPYVMITGNNQQYTYAGLLSADDTGSGLTPGDDASLVGGVVSVPQNKTVLIPIPDSAVYLCVCAIDDNCWPSDVKVVDISCMVHRTGNETIEGNKTFTGNVVIDNRAINQGLSEIKLKGDDSAEGHTESITLMADEYSYSDLPRLTIGSYSGNEVVLSNVADPELDTDAASKHYVDNLVLWRQNIPYVKYPVPSSQVLSSGDVHYLTVATIDRGADAAGNYYGLFLMNATLSLYDSAATPSQGEHMVTIEMMARITNDWSSWGNSIYGNKMVYGVGEPNANTNYRSFNMSSLINLNTSYRYISFIVKIRNLGPDEITLGADGSGSTSEVSVVNLGIPVNFI